MYVVVFSLVGPKRPRTFNNPEWDAAIKERMLQYQMNPIEGFTGKHNPWKK